ncbi:MAG: hypothetical protein HKN27_13800 [Silicimonas sp.]|nr:hypothetical protein [Silicimonas sp.]
MMEQSIYQLVKDKLITHGVKKSDSGGLTLSDKKLFALFVDLERARQAGSFAAVTAAVQDIETYLLSINKQHLMAFAYMYLRFSDLTPKRVKLDEEPGDGTFIKSQVYTRDLTDEEILIGLWAKVKYEGEGEAFLRIVYAGT